MLLELLGKMRIGRITAQLRCLCESEVFTEEELLRLHNAEVYQLLKYALAEISLVHSLQIAAADVCASAQFLHAPAGFRTLLHFLTYLCKQAVELRILDAVYTLRSVCPKLAFLFKLLEGKAEIADKCAVLRLIAARQFPE